MRFPRQFRFSSRFATPFVAGCLTVAALMVVYVLEWPAFHRMLRSFDERITDSFFQLRGAEAPSTRIVIVDIDEASLKKLGQWPWPRTVVARLIRRIANAEPAVLGLDVIFPEKDRTSPANFLPLFEEATGAEIDLGTRPLDNDAVLGDAVAEAECVVLGYMFILTDDGLPPGMQNPLPMCSMQYIPPDPWGENRQCYDDIRTVFRPLLNVDAIGAAPLSEGFINTIPDEDGTIRRVPLLLGYPSVEMHYPSLAMEMVRERIGAAGYTVRSSSSGVLGISVGERFIPTDSGAQMAVNWRGGAGTFPRVSASAVLAGDVEPDRFRDAIVLLGSSAAALHDLRVTPYGVTPGVEIHANIIDNLLAGDMLRHDPGAEYAMALTFVGVGGLALSLLISRASAPKCALLGIALLCIAVLGSYLLFRSANQPMGLTYPVSSIVLVFLVVSLFNYFTEGRERQFIRQAFSHYVSENVVATMMRHPEQLSLRGEERELSVLFCDIRNFTGISETMTAPQLSEFLNEYLTGMTDRIMDAGGTVDKFIGDAVVAIWGAPLTDPDHPVHAVRAALRMNEWLADMRGLWEEQGRPPIYTGFGINSGLMNVGNMGSRSRFDYTVIGDNVNLASRLEGLNKVYGTSILCSDATRKATGDTFAWRTVDRVTVKGRTQPVTILEPLREGPPDPDEREYLRCYEDALAAFYKREFTVARDRFERLNTEHPAPIVAYWLNQARTFEKNPPPPDWGGITVQHEK